MLAMTLAIGHDVGIKRSSAFSPLFLDIGRSGLSRNRPGQIEPHVALAWPGVITEVGSGGWIPCVESITRYCSSS